MKEFEQQMTALAIRATIFEIVMFLIGMFILYIVIRAAVRDGIKESGIVDAITSLRRPVETPNLPPMKADR